MLADQNFPAFITYYQTKRREGMDYESLLELLNKRRSIRKFKETPIKDDEIQKIVETVHYTPSGMNSQPWEVVVVRKPGLKNILAGYIQKAMREAMEKRPDMPDGTRPQPPMGFIKAPVFILIFSDTRTNNFIPPMDDERLRYLTYSNLALGFYNMLLAATTLGLGAQWISIVSNASVEDKIKDFLRIPEPMRLYAMMALGYPDMTPIPKKIRETKDIVHYDQCCYDDFRNNDDLKAFFNRVSL